jgi:hypothetical protein
MAPDDRAAVRRRLRSMASCRSDSSFSRACRETEQRRQRKADRSIGVGGRTYIDKLLISQPIIVVNGTLCSLTSTGFLFLDGSVDDDLSAVDLRDLVIRHESFRCRASTASLVPKIFGVDGSLTIHLLKDGHLVVASSKDLVDLVVPHLAIVVVVIFFDLGFEKGTL